MGQLNGLCFDHFNCAASAAACHTTGTDSKPSPPPPPRKLVCEVRPSWRKLNWTANEQAEATFATRFEASQNYKTWLQLFSAAHLSGRLSSGTRMKQKLSPRTHNGLLDSRELVPSALALPLCGWLQPVARPLLSSPDGCQPARGKASSLSRPEETKSFK